jgi:hypothetical protein
MPWRDICEWARRNHITTDEGAARDQDLAQVNQARSEMGLPPFQLVQAHSRHEPLAPLNAIAR